MLPRIYDPFAEMEEMMRYLPSVRKDNSIQQRGFVPAMDVYETETDVMVETPLAGMSPKDVEVSVEKGILTIQGESKKEHEVEEKNYYRKEVRSGSFYRKVDLPKAVKEDEVTAEFEDGILKITCPKAEPSKSKKVNVKVIKKGKKS
ncbi:MAG: Hsp20/alpha crystallin family protein [Candidatus Magasanikbacteria bacterium]|jgi:HSP20 family protein|nr:Hsp20/alpha crystallin family protein [Candidatus Magasanikbacteria bacterium]MBT4314989.1 Hsp20/alpha crystallin family protein [Candidatus Magasanikbacteria bacterium]MBT4546945.1 Hsp20/alpha crystallin family protein [Candidatus Magasanikbacteria bacterium]MBT6819567.1 Hsp20/alpha crystallin family protein [Candidatus Magasanikbacteria bacterium]